MKFRWIIFTVLCLLPAQLFAGVQISDYTAAKLREFSVYRMHFSAYENVYDVLNDIDTFEAEIQKNLAREAVDYEQEKLIWESEFAMERYVYKFDLDKGQKNIRIMLREQMKRNEAWLKDHEATDGANKWLYVLTGDVTSCYMTFSVAVTLLKGLWVRELYEKAVEQDPLFQQANTNLGQWLFYAPGIFGGGKKKALARFQQAYDGARTEVEQYFAGVYLSQGLLENKESALSSQYLSKSDKMNPNSKWIATIKRINAQNISLFKYNRKRSGIDDNDPNATEL